MNALFAIVIVFIIELCNCVLVDRTHERKFIKAKTRIELYPIEVDTRLNAIIKLTPPILNIPEVLFIELIKPDGNAFNLDDGNLLHPTIDPVVMNLDVPPSNEFSITTRRVKMGSSHQILGLNKTILDGLVIGPLLEESHGNWLLSAFLKDIDDRWVEMFQIITIRITEYIPNQQNEVKRQVQEDFQISFAYPIKGLETCELISPRTSNIASIHLDEDSKNRCGYIIKDLTENDAGLWEIIGVGNIIYRGQTKLEIINKKYTKI